MGKNYKQQVTAFIEQGKFDEATALAIEWYTQDKTANLYPIYHTAHAIGAVCNGNIEAAKAIFDKAKILGSKP